MTSILLIGDPHYKMDNLNETNQMAEEILALVIERKPNIVCILGDILHTHDKISVGPLVRSIEFLRKLRDVCTELVVLIGNHDRPNNSIFLTEDHPFTALKSWERITIVDDVTPLEFTIGDKKMKFLALPYIPVGRLEEALLTKGLSTKDDSLNQFVGVFLHQEIIGAKMGAIISTVGDEWPHTAPMAFSGHIHDYDMLQSNFIYVGTPIQHGYADKPDKAVAFAYFNASLHYTHMERIRLRVPQKTQIRLTPEELAIYVPEENVHVKITVMGDPVAIRKVMELKEVKAMCSRPGIKISICDTRSAVIAPTEVVSRTIHFHDRFKEILERESEPIKTICSELGLF